MVIFSFKILSIFITAISTLLTAHSVVYVFFIYFICLFVFFFFFWWWHWSLTKGLAYAFYHLSHTPPLFFPLVIFQVRLLIFAWDWYQTTILLPMAFPLTGITGPCHHTQVIDWKVVSQVFCLGWPWTMIFLISTSSVAWITGVSHHDWHSFLCLSFLFFFKKCLTM
jgi:hypothetical protein